MHSRFQSSQAMSEPVSVCLSTRDHVWSCCRRRSPSDSFCVLRWHHTHTSVSRSDADVQARLHRSRLMADIDGGCVSPQARAYEKEKVPD